MQYIVEVLAKSGMFVDNQGRSSSREKARVFRSMSGITNSLGKRTFFGRDVVICNKYGARKFSTCKLDETEYKVHPINI